MKVYCKNCRWFNSHCSDTGSSHTCHHPLNKKTEDTYLESKVYYNLAPSELNKNNDCGMHEATESSKWLIAELVDKWGR